LKIAFTPSGFKKRKDCDTVRQVSIFRAFLCCTKTKINEGFLVLNTLRPVPTNSYPVTFGNANAVDRAKPDEQAPCVAVLDNFKRKAEDIDGDGVKDLSHGETTCRLIAQKRRTANPLMQSTFHLAAIFRLSM
jgi:hypothetical protein